MVEARVTVKTPPDPPEGFLLVFTPAPRAGRRRAQTTRRLPGMATLSSLSRPTVAKSLIGLGLASSVVAAIAMPVRPL